MAHAGMAVISEFLRAAEPLSGSIDSQRRAMAELAADARLPEGCRLEPGVLGGRPVEIVVPDAGTDAAAVVYLHGGAYCLGSPATHRNLAGRLSTAAGCPVHVLDYRLAPEDPHPAALADAVSAVEVLLAGGLPPGRIGLAGDSAGGGLVIATLLSMQRSGSELPAAAVCFSPWVDLTQSGASHRRLAHLDPVLSKSNLDALAAAYVGAGDPRDELVSPLFAERFCGLPPVLVDVGEHEVLADDAARLADRLARDGVAVTFTVWPEMIHVFQAFPGPLVPEADESVRRAGRFLAQHLGLAAGTRPDGTAASLP